MLTLIVVLAVIGIILLIPISVRVYLKLEDKDFKSHFYGKYGVITVFNSDKRKKEKPKPPKTDRETADKPKKDKKPMIKQLWQRRSHVKRLIVSVVSYIVKHLIKITKLHFKGVIGLEDAATTAVAYGALSGVLYNSLGAVDKVVRVQGIDIDFKPDFDNEVIFIEFESIIRTNIYHILALAVIALVRAIPVIRKEKNNGKSN